MSLSVSIIVAIALLLLVQETALAAASVENSVALQPIFAVVAFSTNV